VQVVATMLYVIMTSAQPAVTLILYSLQHCQCQLLNSPTAITYTVQLPLPCCIVGSRSH